LPRRCITTALLTLLLALSAAGLQAQAFDAEGYEKAIATIKCDCGCHPQSLKDCACGYAAEKRDSIHAMMTDTGMTGEAVVAKYIADFGEQIRIAPPARGFNLVAWLGPLIVLALALPALYLMLKRWQSLHPAAVAADSELPAEIDSGYVDRVHKQLEEME